jgi:hypothetical protein
MTKSELRKLRTAETETVDPKELKRRKRILESLPGWDKFCREAGITIKQVAAKSGLSESTVYRDINLGHLQAYRPKSRLIIVEEHPASFRAWLVDRRQRCGLTIESRTWLEEMESLAA